MTQTTTFERKTTEWLSRHVGQTLWFRIGNIPKEAKLQYIEIMNIYYFRVDGSEFDARICEISS